jgi:hypothetical protein
MARENGFWKNLYFLMPCLDFCRGMSPLSIWTILILLFVSPVVQYHHTLFLFYFYSLDQDNQKWTSMPGYDSGEPFTSMDLSNQIWSIMQVQIIFL